MNAIETKLKNTLVLANAVELAATVINNLAGEEVSNGLNGEYLSSPALCSLIAVKLQSTLSIYLADRG